MIYASSKSYFSVRLLKGSCVEENLLIFVFSTIFFFTNMMVVDGQERAKAQEERSRNILEYRKFLESCDFIKVLF